MPPISPQQRVVKRARQLPLSSTASLSTRGNVEQDPQQSRSRVPYRDPIVFFSEEIALHIFEALAPADLVSCASVSRLWHRLVNDQMLWRRLFLKYRFISPRGISLTGPEFRQGHRPSKRSFATPRRSRTRPRSTTDMTPHRPLQSQQPRPRIPASSQCWKALYKLNYNWIVGQAQVTSLPVQRLIHMDRALLESHSSQPRHADELRQQQQHSLNEIRNHRWEAFGPPLVQFKDTVILTASRSTDMVHLWRVRSTMKTVGGVVPGYVAHGEPEYRQTFVPNTLGRLTLGETVPSSADPTKHPSSRSSYLCLDKSTGNGTGRQRVMVGYDSGHFAVFEYTQDKTADLFSVNNHNNSSSSVGEDGTDSAILEEPPPIHEIGYTGDQSDRRRMVSEEATGRIRSGYFRYPVLATFSDDGVISIYRIQDTGSESWCRRLFRLYGTVVRSPIEMELKRLAPPAPPSQASGDESKSEPPSQVRIGRWRLQISYGVELYDGSWTVRVQEIEFEDEVLIRSVDVGADEDVTENATFQNPSEAASDTSGGDMDYGGGGGRMHDWMIGGQGGIGSGWTTDKQRRPTLTAAASFRLSAALGQDPLFCGLTSSSLTQARINSIATISIAYPLVVTTHNDNTMNVFSMTRERPGLPGREDLCHKDRLRLEHVSTLYGHCGAVSSVSIEARSGRLVSASMDRSIKVWTMTFKESRQWVHQCTVTMNDINKSWTENGQMTKEEGLGLVWVGSDDEKIVSMNCDGTVKVWQFS